MLINVSGVQARQSEPYVMSYTTAVNSTSGLRSRARPSLDIRYHVEGDFDPCLRAPPRTRPREPIGDPSITQVL